MKAVKRLLLKTWWNIGIPSIVQFRRTLSKPRAMPSFVLIGTQKGGTTALFDYLVEHPEIGGSLRKEVHYFDLHAHKPLDWYKAHFPRKHAFKHVGESSPYYLFHPLVPERMAKVLPHAKLIVLLREPVSRAYSHYQMMKRKGMEKRSFKQAIEEEDAIIAKAEETLLANPTVTVENHQHKSYASRGDYLKQLDRWLAHYNEEQLLVLSSESLQQNPKETLATIYSFLGVDKVYPKNLKPKHVGKYPPIDSDIAQRLKTRYKGQEESLKQRFPSYRPPSVS